MNMPGFTAEASVYRPGSAYRAAYGAFAGNASAVVIPQQLALDLCKVGCIDAAILCSQGCNLAPFPFNIFCAFGCRDAREECEDACEEAFRPLPPPPPPRPPRPCQSEEEPCPPSCCPGLICRAGRCVERPRQPGTERP